MITPGGTGLVRTRRALRGLAGTEHPRVFIWGLLEARLQSVDVMVLGGLVEGVWPPRTDPGPWLSRPMRARAGLPSTEQWVGQAAHDFVSAACAALRVILSCPTRKEGAPAVPARWLVRLETYLKAAGMRLPEHPAASWARTLDLPADGARAVAAPRPCPPIATRPRRLSVTDIETWLRDPYAVYARHVLGLQPLPALDEATDAADYGTLVHEGLHEFLRVHGAEWPPDAREKLRGAFARALMRRGLRRALVAWWAPRLDRIADWIAKVERERRSSGAPLVIAAERKGSWLLARPGGPFQLAGRADRIERRADDRLVIIDYKTGSPPTQTDVEAGLAPQLLLEAAMAEAGAFGEDIEGPPGELAYWRLSGGYEPGELFRLFKGDQAKTRTAVDDASERLQDVIDLYDQPGRCYLSHPHPARAPRFSDYAQLARVAEWASSGDES